MPFIQISYIGERTREEKRQLIENLTSAASLSLQAPRQTVRILIQEVPAQNWGVAGEPKG